MTSISSSSAPQPRSVSSPSSLTPSTASSTGAPAPSSVPADDFVSSGAAAAGVASAAPRVSVLELFESIAPDTKWADLPVATRAQLERVVKERLGAFEKAWGAQGLRAKQHVLRESPTPEMIQAFNEFIVAGFPNQVGPDFKASEAITNKPLLNVLKDLYLAKAGQARSASEFYGGTGKDWDGQKYPEFALPSKTVIHATSKLAAEAIQRARKIPDGDLSEVERAVRDRAVLKLTGLATGSFGSYGVGGDDLLTPYGRASWGYDLNNAMTDGGGAIYKGRDEDFIKDATAYWLSPELTRVNAGTVLSATKDTMPMTLDPQQIKDQLGDPATSLPAKAAMLLGSWFSERLALHPDANQQGWKLSPKERDTMWRSFQADMLVPEASQLSVEEYGKTLQAVTAKQTEQYKAAASAAIEALFPPGGPLVSDAARAKVLAEIQAQPTFGTLMAAIPASLDAATGGTQASALFNQELEGLGSVGGYDDGAAIKPEDQAKVQAAWDDVKAFIGRHYSGGKFDLAALLQKDIATSTTMGSSTDRTGKITIDLRPVTNTAGLYAMLLHEAKHALDFLTKVDTQVEGSAWEGAATLVQERPTRQLLEEAFAADPKKAALAKFSLINTDTRYGARSEATQVAFQAGPKEDGIAAAKEVAKKWGLTPEQTETLLQRAFNGLQYTQYKSGMAMQADLMDYLQSAAGPGAREIDPFVIQMYGLGSAAKDAQTVQRLKQALGIP